jgi:hypothetical protein
MDDIKGLFIQLINSSSLDEATKQEWLNRVHNEGPSAALLNEFEDIVGKIFEDKADSIKQEMDQAMEESDAIAADFNRQLSELERNESKKHDQGLIAAIRAKLGI